MLASIPFGIGVGHDKLFGPKWFWDHLSKLRFPVIFEFFNASYQIELPFQNQNVF